MKWLALAWRNVLRNRRRTLLTVAIFATGTLAVLSAFGFVSASFHGLREATIAAQVGHFQIGFVAGRDQLGQADPASRGA